MSIEETLRLRYSHQYTQPKVSPTESELTPNAYYNVDDNQNVMDNGVDLIDRGVIDMFTVYKMRKYFTR